MLMGKTVFFTAVIKTEVSEGIIRIQREVNKNGE